MRELGFNSGAKVGRHDASLVGAVNSEARERALHRLKEVEPNSLAEWTHPKGLPEHSFPEYIRDVDLHHLLHV